MNYKNFLFALFLLINSQHLFSQSDYLNNFDAFLIGPDNVDIFHDFQMEYYIEKYQALREELLVDKTDNREHHQALENKKFKSRKNKERMDDLKIENDLIVADLKKVNHYLNLWVTWKGSPGNQAFLEAYQPTVCYQIEGMDFTYFPDDYRLDTLGKGSLVWWNEVVEEIMLEFKYELVEVEPAREDWVQKKADRNCLSANPNDCLVWCLVEVPAKIDTLVIQAAKMGCVEGFFLDESDSMCKNAIISEEKIEVDLQVKVIDILTGREIRMKSFEKMECY